MCYDYIHPEMDDPLVDTFFEMASTDADDGQVDLIMPDGTHGLMYLEQGNFYRESDKGFSHLPEGNFYLFGQKSNPIKYHFGKEKVKAYGVKLKPTAVSDLFGVAAHEVTDLVINLSDIIKATDFERLKNMDGDSMMKIKRLYSLLQDQRKKCDNNIPPVVNILLQEIHFTKGLVSIQALAKNHNLGYKRIERLFKRHIGLTPKMYTRIVRFNSTIQYAFGDKASNLTDIAYQSGFFDQNHFIKETKKFTGYIPSQVFGAIEPPFEKEHLSYLLNRGY